MSSELNPYRTNVGPSLRAVREAAGITLGSLAAASHVSKSHLSRVESGERRISDSLLLEVLEAIVSRLMHRRDAA